ncbi:hypothetical protein GZ77_07520 [Endozoicomonas montiporae]|uniref:AAA domain-containing protein n=2 Tax=Endozoicomonas montiporae TaxID=1027273 RepID=A0A081N733_9GAMM|nr:hypothetical protein [Endozoicomonas montiporae]AMO55927.1 putative ATPase [Endozoicomonas montiporae CL-33]KEQ14256.1 hypothetical protein GZ77_07520 [Endozoicomonas montiporae]
MLELTKELSRDRAETRSGGDLVKDDVSLILYQTKACFNLLKEAMLCEGLAAPSGQSCPIEQVSGVMAKAEEPLLFIEVEDCPFEVALSLKQQVSHNTRVILIGREDRISTYRALEEMGFYYLLWPAEKSEVISFLQALMDDVHRSKGPHFARTAMRIAVVSLKGGTGCTLVAAEMAYGLGRMTRQPVIIADHGYCQSNMAIMLGKKDLARRPISEEGFRHHTLTNILDPVGVQSQLVRVESGISYLGFESREVDSAQMREYTHNMIATQLRDTNFIIEDYSASVNFYPDPQWLCPSVDCVLLVVQPSLSGLHETREFLRQFRAEMANCDDPARLLVVVNHCVPPDTIDKAMVEQFLDYPVSMELPFQKHCETWLTSGKRFMDGKNSLAQPFQQLVRIVLGQPVEKPQSLLQRLKGLMPSSRNEKTSKRSVPTLSELNDNPMPVEHKTDPETMEPPLKTETSAFKSDSNKASNPVHLASVHSAFGGLSGHQAKEGEQNV